MRRIHSVMGGVALTLIASYNYSALAGTERFESGKTLMPDKKYQSYKRVKIIDLPISTQGPLWPPSEITNNDGDFLLVGNLLKEVEPGVIGMVPNQAALIDKNTIPPLDENGVEDPDNWFGGTYEVIRKLDLREGSDDLNTVLFTTSFGPATGNGGAPQIPASGESDYNLNKDLTICSDIFPTTSQETDYFRPSYPLHKVPVLGYQGDGVAYNPNTGAPYDPMSASDDPSCAATGCPGEDAVDQRANKPITLGDWIKSKGKLKIKLTKKNREGEYTHAKFKFKLKNMLPNSIYTVWVVRSRQMPVPGIWERRDIDPIAIPNLLYTDENGSTVNTFEVRNPFPDPSTDTQGMRIIGLSVVYHSDHQNWGACFSRFGPGVDAHVVFNTLNSMPTVPGTLPDMTDFITVDP